MTRIVGFDPSITAFGALAIDRSGQRPRFIASIRIPTDTKLSDLDRYRLIWRKLEKFVIAARAELVVIEEQKRVQAGAHERGEFRGDNHKVNVVYGAALAVAFSLRLPVQEVAPQTAKIAVLGKGGGNADKAVVRARLELILGVSGLTEAEGDAGAVAMAGR